VKLSSKLSSKLLGLAVLFVPAVVYGDAPKSQYAQYLPQDEFIRDLNTTYHWQRKASEASVPLRDSYCSLPLYRVPTVRELATLIDNQPRTVLVGTTQRTLYIDQNAFPRTPPEPFWTATRAPDGRVFVVDFGTGRVRLQAPTEKAYVRCVQRT